MRLSQEEVNSLAGKMNEVGKKNEDKNGEKNDKHITDKKIGTVAPKKENKKRKKMKFAIGKFVTNEKYSVIGKVIGYDDGFADYPYSVKILYARHLDDIGKVSIEREETLVAIKKKGELIQVKEKINVLRKTGFKYPDGTDISLGDVIEYKSYVYRAGLMLGYVVDNSTVANQLKIRPIDDVCSFHGSSFFVDVASIVKKFGTYNIKLKKPCSYLSQEEIQQSIDRNKFKVDKARVFNENELPEMTKDFLFSMREEPVVEDKKEKTMTKKIKKNKERSKLSRSNLTNSANSRQKQTVLPV